MSKSFIIRNLKKRDIALTEADSYEQGLTKLKWNAEDCEMVRELPERKANGSNANNNINISSPVR